MKGFKQVSARYGNTFSKIGTGLALLGSTGMAMAQTSPGQAIASELSGGKADMGQVFAAVAILIGILLVWAYVKRSAK
jgi:hypothetical protein